MAKTIQTRVQHKHDIESNWKKAINFVPLQGEIVVYDIDENYNDGKVYVNAKDVGEYTLNLDFSSNNVRWNGNYSHNATLTITPFEFIFNNYTIFHPGIATVLTKKGRISSFAYKLLYRKNSTADFLQCRKKDYSFLIASSALIFTARLAGQNPETSPISVANTREASASHSGMIDVLTISAP